MGLWSRFPTHAYLGRETPAQILALLPEELTSFEVQSHPGPLASSRQLGGFGSGSLGLGLAILRVRVYVVQRLQDM